MGGALVKIILIGVAGIISVLVSLALCGIHAIYSAGVYMTFDEPF